MEYIIQSNRWTLTGNSSGCFEEESEPVVCGLSGYGMTGQVGSSKGVHKPRCPGLFIGVMDCEM